MKEELLGTRGFTEHVSKTDADLTVSGSLSVVKWYLGSFFSMKVGSSAFPTVSNLSEAKDNPNPTDYSNPTGNLLVLPTVSRYAETPEITELLFDERPHVSQIDGIPYADKVYGKFSVATIFTGGKHSNILHRFLLRIRWFNGSGVVTHSHFLLSDAFEKSQIDSNKKISGDFQFSLESGVDVWTNDNFLSSLDVATMNQYFSDITGKDNVSGGGGGSNFCGKITIEARYSNGMETSLYSDPQELTFPCPTTR